MAINFSKRINVGVSVTPGVGIEVAQIDFNNQKVLKYASVPFNYNGNADEPFDLDIFKESLLEALTMAEIPAGSGLILNLPATIFAVRDWPASMDPVQILNNIEDEIMETPSFKNNPGEPSYSWCKLANSTIQFNKIAYIGHRKALIAELAYQIKDLNYRLVAIDVSVNSTLNALMYTNRVDIQADTNWTLLIVDDSSCRVIPMLGKNYVDSYTEYVKIGKVLDDSENYDIVTNAVNPILAKNPSQLLYVLSKTDVISAKLLAPKLDCNSQIVHQEANAFNQEPFINVEAGITTDDARKISLDVIGAAIRSDFVKFTNIDLNLFNEQLGDIYLSQVPLKYMGIELTIENMLKIGVAFAVIILAIAFSANYLINQTNAGKEAEVQKITSSIAELQKFIDENKEVSSDLFNEADEIRIGLTKNKDIYSYYTIVGTEIPKKLWLTKLELGQYITIEGQADNLESVYAFFRNIKDYNPNSTIKLQKLGLAGKSKLTDLNSNGDFDTDSILTSLNADFYEFRISNAPERAANEGGNKEGNNKDGLPELEPLE